MIGGYNITKYENLKDYLRLNNMDVISKGIKDYLEKNSLENKYVIDEITLLTLGGIVPFPDNVMTFVIGVSSTSSYKGDDSNAVYYYNVMMTGNISKGFSELHILAVDKVTLESIWPETTTSLFGLPDISYDRFEEEAEKIHSEFCSHILQDEKHKYWFPVIAVKEKYKKSVNMHMWPAELEENILGEIRFERSTATIYSGNDFYTPYPNSLLPENTILLNVKYYRNEIGYDDIITATHELIHWEIHQEYFKIRQLLEGRKVPMKCSEIPMKFDSNMSDRDKALWYAEWQANELAIRVAIPKYLIKEAINEYENSISEIHHVINRIVPHDGLYYENMIFKLSWDFNVPPEVIKKRFRQLGYDYADGTFVNVDGFLYPSFTFEKGSLQERETFVIDSKNYKRLLRENAEFAELIKNRRLVYTGYVICINDAKYIRPFIRNKELSFELSDYACEHVNECCLKFSLRKEICTTIYTKFNHLYKLDNEEYLKENKLTPDAINDHKSDQRMKEDKKEALRILFEMDKANVRSFKDALRFHMERLKIDIEDMFDEAYLKDNTFLSYYKGKRNPSLKKAMIICNKLELPYDLCTDLLKRARITLNIADDLDSLYDYFLTITNASIEVWELHLERNGFPPLLDQQN